MIDWVFAVGRVVGFGTAGGARPALTLAIIGAMDRLNVGPEVVSSFRFLDHWVAILIFAALAIFESKFDIVQPLARIQDTLLMPWRVVGGAIAAAATVGHGLPGLLIGLVIGVVAAFMGQSVQHGARPTRASTSVALTLISLSEDLSAFGGAIATGLYSLLGYAFFGTNIWLLFWLMHRRRLKYRRLPT